MIWDVLVPQQPITVQQPFATVEIECKNMLAVYKTHLIAINVENHLSQINFYHVGFLLFSSYQNRGKTKQIVNRVHLSVDRSRLLDN